MISVGLGKEYNGWMVGPWRSDFEWERKCNGGRWEKADSFPSLAGCLLQAHLLTFFLASVVL